MLSIQKSFFNLLIIQKKISTTFILTNVQTENRVLIDKKQSCHSCKLDFSQAWKKIS